MKLSASLFFTDILPHRRKLLNKILKNKIFNNNTPAEVFASLKKAGFDGIELLLPQYIKPRDEDLLDVKKIIDKYDMSVLSVHQTIRFFTKTSLKEIAEIFRVAEIFGAKVIVLHTSLAGKKIFTETYVKGIHDLQKKYGIKVGFENMEKYLVRLHLRHVWHEDNFADLMKKNDFHITLDTTHLAHSGGDIIEFYKKNKDRVANIHLSDYRSHFLNGNFRPIRYKHLPLGKGELQIKKFIETLKKENYKGLVTLELHTDLAGFCDGAEVFKAVLDQD